MSSVPAKQPPAIELAFAEHRAFVRERLRGLGVAAADLDDAAQDVFEVLVRRIADYDPHRPIRAWMAGMARKVARRYRERGRRAIVPLDERRPALDDSPEDRAAQAEAWQVLQRFIERLEPERWAVFVLSEIEGLRGSEIAAELGVNQNTVYARLRSARRAFELELRRHRARERRAWMVVVWPRRWLAPAVVIGSVSLGGGAMMIAAGHCGLDESTLEYSRLREEATPSAPVSESAEAHGSTRRRSPLVKDTRSDSNAEIWHSGGSGYSNGRTTSGERYMLSVEQRYRFEGERLILEVIYIGDEAVTVDAAGHHLVLDGFELIDGVSEWEIEVAAGQLRTVSATLRAAHEGVVRLRVKSGRPEGVEGVSSSHDHAWVNDAGQLRHCNDHECEAPVGNERLTGKIITVHVHNECSVVKEFVLFGGYPELQPDDSVTVYSMQPDERRTMQIDAGQWFLSRKADGKIGGGVHTDTDGSSVTFSGRGDECSSTSTTSPNCPPAGATSEPLVDPARPGG